MCLSASCKKKIWKNKFFFAFLLKKGVRSGVLDSEPDQEPNPLVRGPAVPHQNVTDCLKHAYTLTVGLEAVLLVNVVFVCQEGGLNRRPVPTAAAQRREVGRLVQHLEAPSTIS
jgi:hypothetical protein